MIETIEIQGTLYFVGFIATEKTDFSVPSVAMAFILSSKTLLNLL